jgi:hypothetical protein
MSKMGGMMGGGGGGGGGMMQGLMSKIPMPHKNDMSALFANSGASRGPSVMPGSNPYAYKNRGSDTANRPWLDKEARDPNSAEMQAVRKGGKIRYQMGGGIDPAFFDYLSKVTGQGQQQLQVPDNFMQPPAAPEMTAQDPTQMAGAVQNPPTDTPAQNMGQPMPGQQPMPTIDDPMAGANTVGKVNQPGDPKADTGKMTDPMSAVMGTMASNKGQYATDERGVTEVPDSGEAMGDAMGKLKKGDVLGAAMGAMSHMVGKRSAMRRNIREEEQWGSQMEQAMKHSSVYNDPNSVYYAAKDGAAIPGKMKQNNNLTSMMAYQNGGRTGVFNKAAAERNSSLVLSKDKDGQPIWTEQGGVGSGITQGVKRTDPVFPIPDSLPEGMQKYQDLPFVPTDDGGVDPKTGKKMNLGGMMKGILPFQHGGGTGSMRASEKRSMAQGVQKTNPRKAIGSGPKIKNKGMVKAAAKATTKAVRNY